MAWVNYIVSGLPETLIPGRIGEALFQSASLRSDAVGCMTPAGPGAVRVEISALAALSLRTPMRLPVRDKRLSALWTLRHPDDATGAPDPGQIVIGWTDGGGPPAPGALSLTLAEAIGAHAGADDLGVALLGRDTLHTSVPLGWVLASSWPSSVVIDGRTFSVGVVATPAGEDEKKKPDAQLSAAVDRCRASLADAAEPKAAAITRLATRGRALLAEHPADTALFSAFSTLVSRDFQPPQPVTLPADIADASVGSLREFLQTRDGQTLAAMADGVVSVPDLDAEPQAAARALEILIAGSPERAVVVLDGLAKGATDPERQAQIALWRFRAVLRQDEERSEDEWATTLTPLLTHRSQAPAVWNEACALANAGWLGAAQRRAEPVRGLNWLSPCLGGLRIANLGLALARRPKLKQVLAQSPAPFAEVAGPGDHQAVPWGSELARALDAVEGADRAGNFDEGTEILGRAWRDHGGRADLAEAIIARAEALGIPEIIPAELAAQARPTPPRWVAPEPPRPTRPAHGWSRWIDGPEAAPAAFLEAAGSVQIAAARYAEDPGLDSLIQGVRLRAHLGGQAREALADRLREMTIADELSLADDVLARRAAEALFLVLDEGSERDLWQLRLGASERPLPQLAADEPAAPTLAEDDPHTPKNRVLAADQLMAQGHDDAAGNVLAALLRKVQPEDREVWSTVCRRVGSLMSLEAPPEDLVQTVIRRLRATPAEAEPLLTVFVESPLAAYPIHDTLLSLGADDDHERPDGLRVGAFAAWLGIWRASSTPPTPEVITSLADNHPDRFALLALAAARLSKTSDPVAAAHDWLKKSAEISDTDERAKSLLGLSA